MDGHMYCEIFPQNSIWSRRCLFRNFRPHRVPVATHDHKFVTDLKKQISCKAALLLFNRDGALEVIQTK